MARTVKSQDKIGLSTPQTQVVSHPDVLGAIRACYIATSTLVKLQTKDQLCFREDKIQAGCYNELFYLLFARRPTKAEVYYMTGGSALICDKCQKEVFPDANGVVICQCAKESV